MVGCGLPEPEIDAELYSDDGAWLARGDLVYRQWKMVIEYDGWQHERDAKQRQWDHLRREQLEAAGWRIIVITTADMAQPRTVTLRVDQALRRRGFDGPAPRFGRWDTDPLPRKVRQRADLAAG